MTKIWSVSSSHSASLTRIMKRQMINSVIHKTFLDALESELVPAMGCTEPIALAYASARAREILGGCPDEIIAYCSGNIIKNVRCVQIPHSNGLRGIEAAVALGALGGDAGKDMEVLESVTDDQAVAAASFANSSACRI